MLFFFYKSTQICLSFINKEQLWKTVAFQQATVRISTPSVTGSSERLGKKPVQTFIFQYLYEY